MKKGGFGKSKQTRCRAAGRQSGLRTLRREFDFTPLSFYVPIRLYNLFYVRECTHVAKGGGVQRACVCVTLGDMKAKIRVD